MSAEGDDVHVVDQPLSTSSAYQSSQSCRVRSVHFLDRSLMASHSPLHSSKEESAYPLACSSCRGNFTVPANLAVSEVYFLVQAPAGLEFQVPTPLMGTQPFLPPLPFGINCALEISTSSQNIQGTSVNGSLEAIFDSGAVIPLTGEYLGGWLFFHTHGGCLLASSRLRGGLLQLSQSLLVFFLNADRLLVLGTRLITSQS